MVFKLEQNYRSTRTIVDAANSVIVRNSNAWETLLLEGDRASRSASSKPIPTARLKWSSPTCATRSARRATSGQAVILYAPTASRPCWRTLRRRGVPYRIYKGSSFYDHKEVRTWPISGW
ncbi:MAG: 3'-5' exonuclease [Alistipes finegoldii]